MSWLPPDDDESDWSEEDVRIRPNPRGSRPRTKQRPDHSDAVPGRVLSVDRGRYTVMVDEDGPTEHTVTATRAKDLNRRAIVTGDLVDLVGDSSGSEGTLARIVRIGERTTLLRRSADDTDPVERVIVANSDQLCVVVAAADPEPRPRLIDRYLVAAFDAGISPLLVVTKTDVADPAPFLSQFAALGVPVILSGRGAVPLVALRAALKGHRTVAVGHSGVGKSTLVNALVPTADRATGKVNAVTGRGRHTSSSTVSLRLPGGGWVIDTPGIRSFGLAHVDPSRVVRSFPDLAPVIAECPRGCTHREDAPDCELDEAVAEDRVNAARVDSLRRLLASLSG